jgi:hypothetical protein
METKLSEMRQTTSNLTSKCILGITAICLLWLLSGCATPTKIEHHSKHTVTLLIKISVKNSYRPLCGGIGLKLPMVERDENKSVWLQALTMKFDEFDASTSTESYLLLMELEPGDYVIRGFYASTAGMIDLVFPTLNGLFFLPLHAQFQSSTPGVFYLGHVQAVLRERKDNEFSAGKSYPWMLGGQQVCGAVSGTFDVSISNQWEKDESNFRENFEELKDVFIDVAILPPFDRDKAQKWWVLN